MFCRIRNLFFYQSGVFIMVEIMIKNMITYFLNVWLFISSNLDKIIIIYFCTIIIVLLFLYFIYKNYQFFINLVNYVDLKKLILTFIQEDLRILFYNIFTIFKDLKLIFFFIFYLILFSILIPFYLFFIIF
jgi:hypothetical protein